MKVVNPNYEVLNIEPIDIALRNKIGISVSGKNEQEVLEKANVLLASDYSQQIKAVRDEVLYNVSYSADLEGDYILNKLLELAKQKG